ncbi:hypothetical protein SDRG_16814 [Saprolegnia diclina VS20]|uniref:Tetraspanin n=1 Tax=Saprolegnia diclina (strain VS20) TaxID=1156394 RepID=T0R010_SAPDV|nr:hypothetical protein SDRG_16814 [Saprolegnia diclina VS20]EQC25318.1 hypothetical protein SDRG_16814 [Saprolegnia diclina VS20]|eukprot:XP_008621256.1 hypothetical protein SDRG_16814 [Saprolegnia diclina VS20]
MCTDISKVTLIVLNLAFVVAGALLIWVGASTSSGWSNIFESASNGSTTTTFNLILAFGVLVLLIAFMGLMGALKRQKCLLYTYSFFVFVALAIFILIMITGFAGASTANKWSDAKFPAEDAEKSVAEAFDTAYCGVMLQHYCAAGSLGDAIAIFSPSTSSALTPIIKALNLNANDQTGLSGLCKSLNSTAAGSLVELNVKTFKTICDECKKTEDVDFSDLYKWGQDNCPLTTSTASWCLSYIETNKYDTATDVVYPKCRPAVLDLFKSFANKIAIGALIFAIAALVVLVMACVVARSGAKDGSMA